MSILLALCLFVSLPAAAQETSVPQSKEQIKLSYAPVVKQVAPAVVNIYSKRVVREQVHPFMNDPFFAPFFRGRGGISRQRVQQSLGSGVIVDPDGVVVTNAHVVDGAQEIIVGLADGREYSAELSLADEQTDVAVIRITEDVNDLPHAELRPSESLEVGDLVLAMGNPFGVGQTVTSGIVSALARSAVNINDYNFFIQTDAAINPGNSGGPLVSMDGGIIGINTAIFSRSGGSLGIGFAIPSEMVNTVLAAEESNYANGGEANPQVARPWLGASFQNVTSDLAESFGLSHPNGALITDLHSRSPLKGQGLGIGDLIIAVDGKTIRDPAELKFRMATVPLEEQAEITVLQEGRERTVQITAIRPPDDPPRTAQILEGNHPLNGVEVSNINPAVASELDLDAEEGVVISAVRDNAAIGGMAGVGDMVLQINGSKVSRVKDVVEALNARERQQSAWQFVFSRNGQTRQLVIR